MAGFLSGIVLPKEIEVNPERALGIVEDGRERPDCGPVSRIKWVSVNQTIRLVDNQQGNLKSFSGTLCGSL